MNELAGLKVAMFTTGHSCLDDRIYYKEAKSLEKFGANVNIIYPKNSSSKEPPADESISFSPYPLAKGVKNRLLFGHKIFKHLMDFSFDIIHCHEPDALYLALLAKRERPKTKVIYDSHEMWGATFATHFKKPCWKVAEYLFDRGEILGLCHVDGAIGAALPISEYFKKYIKKPVVTIFNVPTSSVFPPLEPAPLTGDKFILVHDGHLTFDRGVKTIATAVHLLASEYDISLKIVGDAFGPPGAWLNNFIARYNLENIITKTGWLPYEEVGQAIASGHIGLSGLTRNPNLNICAPNKCFNYMYYGLAQVGPFLPRSHYKILADEGCALLYEPDNPEDLAKAIKRYLDDKTLLKAQRQQAFTLARQKYCWEQMEPLLLKFYQEVLCK